MFNYLLQNARNPKSNWIGRLFLCGMNAGHGKMAEWSFGFLPLDKEQELLDIGCGGGKNIKIMSRQLPDARIYGIDYSEASIKKSESLNRKAVEEGRVILINGNVNDLPFEQDKFDVVTAFETVYFWQPIEQSLAQVYKVLKKGGRFMISCEEHDPKSAQIWTDRISGMKVYTPQDMEELLKQAGFDSLEIHMKGNWMCVICKK